MAKIKPALAMVALVVIGTALILTTYAALSTSQNLSSNGTVSSSANLGVYSDSSCTQSTSSINWGTLTAGSVVSQVIYIKNTSSGLSLSLNMTTSNWSPPSANGPVTITWNQQGTDLQPGQVVAATITLTVSSTEVNITTFNAQINIGGTNP